MVHVYVVHDGYFIDVVRHTSLPGLQFHFSRYSTYSTAVSTVMINTCAHSGLAKEGLWVMHLTLVSNGSGPILR